MKLSVIVPTRERCDTLVHTLRTLQAQSVSDCEFIVSDNASEDATDTAVQPFLDDPRFRYINTKKRLPMASNWEFALGHVKGDFVTIIGDDDGFLPRTLEYCQRLLSSNGMQALVWQKSEYCWPDHIEDAYRNYFSVRLSDFNTEIVDSDIRLNAVVSFKTCYTRLPCLYNSFISTEAIRRVKAQTRTGEFFKSITPDVFSGMALSRVIPRYTYTDYPLTINGASRHSNGTAFTRKAKGAEDPFAKFQSELDIKYDDRLLFAPCATSCIMGELLLVSSHLPSAQFPKPDWRAYVKALAREYGRSKVPEAILESVKHTCDSTGVPMPALHRGAESVGGPELGLQGPVLHFRADSSLVKNVFDASRLLGSVLVNPPPTLRADPVKRAASKILDILRMEAKRILRG